MLTVPHLDIVGDERIQAILDSPDSYVFQAAACETLDGWTTDMGLTAYANPPDLSIYRPPSVSRAGLLSAIRHRFWKHDHTGRRFVGVVLYDAAGERCPLEFRLGAEEIGRIEPGRQDNRRHLVVIDRPVAFQGGMEVFQVTTAGPGACRIETFVLMRDRPEPSTFVPTIERLAVRHSRDPMGTITATVHCTTVEMAVVAVDATPLGEADRAGDGASLVAATSSSDSDDATRPARLHAVAVPGLAPNRHYLLRVQATAPDRSRATAAVRCFTGRSAAEPEAELRAPVEITGLVDGDAAGLPLTFGVPIPPGQVYEPVGCALQGAGSVAPAQGRVLARWPDGSARWVLIDAPCPSGIAPNGRRPATVIFGAQTADGARDLTSTVNADRIVVQGRQVRVTVATDGRGMPAHVERRDPGGQWRQVLGGQDAAGADAAWEVVLGDGRRLHAGRLQDLALEESGPERVVVRYHVPHEDGDGVAHLRSTIRLHVYARQPFVRLVHRLEVVSPELGPASRDGDRRSALDGIGDPAADAAEEAASLLGVRSVMLRLPLAGISAVWEDGQRHPVAPGAAWRLVHEHDLAHRVGTAGGERTVDGRSRGWFRIEAAGNDLALGVRNFWQAYPKGLRTDDGGVVVEILPALSDEPPPGDEDAWHRLYAWRDGDRYKLKVGMALTTELLVVADGGDPTAALAWFERPPAVRPPVDWLNMTSALSPIAPKAGSPLPRYEAMIDRAAHEWLDDRERKRAYGFMNLGDWYGESRWSWGNNEYDAALCHYGEFLRGGDPAWAEFGAEAARHTADVDTCNYSARPDQVGGQYIHMPGHTGGYLPPYFRSKIAGSTMIPSHMWVEGQVIHYLLTGDEAARETLARTGRWLTRHGTTYYDYSSAREAGWHLIHLCAMARLGDDPRFLNAASLIVDKVLERQTPEGGWVRQLTAAHCACPPPRCRGEASFMIGILLSGLRRYHELTAEARVADAIVRGARWLVDAMYDPESRHFRYTTCPTRGIPRAEYTGQVMDGLAYAHRLGGDAMVASVVLQGLEDLGRLGPSAAYHEYGKLLCFEARNVPTLLPNVPAAQPAGGG